MSYKRYRERDLQKRRRSVGEDFCGCGWITQLIVTAPYRVTSKCRDASEMFFSQLIDKPCRRPLSTSKQ
ncbi:hypothetical protein PUN28_018048 [Cardiocondyla obscurior]|uniref:Uncharacterized protein n=1 Tax=Cardiocondyla obscurior TaxID=286306 RepID=A0AAW2EJF3_9HYME